MTTATENVYAPSDIFIADLIADDERLWVSSSENISYRPLFLSVSQGLWVTVARIRKSGIVSRHRRHWYDFAAGAAFSAPSQIRPSRIPPHMADQEDCSPRAPSKANRSGCLTCATSSFATTFVRRSDVLAARSLR